MASVAWNVLILDVVGRSADPGGGLVNVVCSVNRVKMPIVSKMGHLLGHRLALVLLAAHAIMNETPNWYWVKIENRI